MPFQKVQTNRSSTKNQRPAAGSREPGELYVNFADLQLGVSNASKASQDLIAVRFFSAATNYSVGDFVVYNGVGYRAKEAIVSGAFNAAQWDTINVTGSAEPPIAAGTVSQYWRGDKSWQTLDKSAVGLGAVDNTSDANKPISSAEQAALNLKANIASPTFTGDPKAPTPSAGDNDTSIATTAFVAASFAPITSPNFGGDPRAPTPATSDNDTSIATTAYVKANLATYAPLASPAFTGTPTAPTPSPGDSDTSIATTAFVQQEIGNRPLDAPNDTNAYGRKALAWVDVTEEAPSDGVSYGRKNGSWVASVGGAVISDTPPPGPLTPGQLWWESDSGNTYLWFDDGTSQQWVQQNIQPGSAELPGMLSSTAADLSYGFRVVDTPPGTVNRFVWNDKADMTGNDVAEMSESGELTAKNVFINSGGAFSGGTFIGPATGVVLGAPSGSPATIIFRPQGYSSPTNQCTIVPDGSVTAAGNIFAGNTTDFGIIAYPTDRYFAFAGNVFLQWNIATGDFTLQSATGMRFHSRNSDGRFKVPGVLCALNDENFQLTGGGGAQFFKAKSGDYFSNDASGNWACQASGGIRWTSVNVDGNFHLPTGAYKPGGGPFTASSDIRIKDVRGPYEGGLTEILALNPVRYAYKGNVSLMAEPPEAKDGEEPPPKVEAQHAQVLDKEFIGLVAQEAEVPMPELVSLTTGFIDGEEVSDLRSLDSGPLIFALVNAVKELTARIEQLEARPV